MKIIDFKKKGNMVKFYLGQDDLEKWHGDDWNDTPYEHNAGTVYEEFVSGERVMVFGFDDVVFEPADGELNSPYCKDDMIARKVPCICVLRTEDFSENEYMYYGFKSIVGNDKVIRFYFGDKMDIESQEEHHA